MDTLAVINTSGQVWARQMILADPVAGRFSVGAGVEVTGPSVLPDFGVDQFAVAGYNDSSTSPVYIGVILRTGSIFEHFLTASSAAPGFVIDPGGYAKGGLFGYPNAEYVLLADPIHLPIAVVSTSSITQGKSGLTSLISLQSAKERS